MDEYNDMFGSGFPNSMTMLFMVDKKIAE